KDVRADARNLSREIRDDCIEHEEAGAGSADALRARSAVAGALDHPMCQKIAQAAWIEVASRKLAVAAEIDALGKAKAHEEHLVALLFLGQHVVDDQAIAPRLDLFQPGFRRALGACGVAAVAKLQATVGARADARVF